MGCAVLIRLVWTSVISSLVAVSTVSSVCYFPIEYQGTFLIQTKASAAYGGSTVAYSEITVEADAIPPWGRCHLRRGNNVILKDSTGAEDCMRCFHLTWKTPNVIQIHTEGLARCYTTEEAARATCPNDKDVYERRFKEIMLYRKQSPTGTSAIEPVFCPINGRYRFTYTANSGEFRCHHPYSELSNCPQGNGLGVRFRQCSFPDMDVSFLCLGDWDGPNGDRYLALMDLREEPEARPKYRCGLYRVEPRTGKIYVSFALDSTCFTQLNSATDGYESLVLTPLPPRSLPAQVENARCRFPEWTQGRWEHIHVENNAFIFTDPSTFQTISGRCILRENSSPNDKFIIYAITQCGEESYNCVWLMRRGHNVFEFQLGEQRAQQLVFGRAVSRGAVRPEQLGHARQPDAGEEHSSRQCLPDHRRLHGRRAWSGGPVRQGGVRLQQSGHHVLHGQQLREPVARVRSRIVDVPAPSPTGSKQSLLCGGPTSAETREARVQVFGQLGGRRHVVHVHAEAGHGWLSVLRGQSAAQRRRSVHQGGGRQLHARRRPLDIWHEDHQTSVVSAPPVGDVRARETEPSSAPNAAFQGDHEGPTLVPSGNADHEALEAHHRSSDPDPEQGLQVGCSGSDGGRRLRLGGGHAVTSSKEGFANRN